MPYAVTHVLGAIIVADLYRDYFSKHKKLFTMHHIFIAGLGGLLPDIDVAFEMILQLFGQEPWPWLFHGGITHTPLFALIFLIPGIALWMDNRKKWAMYAFMLSFGVFMHLFLDWSLGGGGHNGVMWFFPFSTTGFRLDLLLGFGMNRVPQALDAVLLLGWLWHEEYKHKIKDFF